MLLSFAYRLVRFLFGLLVALAVRFLDSGLARWEHDSQVGPGVVAPLASFTLILTDLAVAMLDAPSSAR